MGQKLKVLEKISETKSWLLINKFDKLLARLMRKNERVLVKLEVKEKMSQLIPQKYREPL